MRTRMQTAMMMTMTHDDNDDDDVGAQDGLALIQTRSWPMDFHHCVQGLRSYLILIMDGSPSEHRKGQTAPGTLRSSGTALLLVSGSEGIGSLSRDATTTKHSQAAPTSKWAHHAHGGERARGRAPSTHAAYIHILLLLLLHGAARTLLFWFRGSGSEGLGSFGEQSTQELCRPSSSGLCEGFPALRRPSVCQPQKLCLRHNFIF